MERVNQIEIQAYFNSGSLITKFNGSYEEAKEYYVGNKFNLGTVEDDMRTCTNIVLIGNLSETGR